MLRRPAGAVSKHDGAKIKALGALVLRGSLRSQLRMRASGPSIPLPERIRLFTGDA
jgi:hypothetical protein